MSKLMPPTPITAPTDPIFTLDLRALGAFRIMAGLVMLLDLIHRATELTRHYTDAGWLPLKAYHADNLHQWYLSFHSLSGEAGYIAMLFAVHFLLILGFLLGYRTRLMTIGCWLFLSSLQNRNLYIESGAEVFLTLLLFWAIFLPIGARFSMDEALNSRPEMPRVHRSMASVAIVLQVLALYFFGAALKCHPQWVSDYTAVYYALHSLFGLDNWAAETLRQMRWVHAPLTIFVYYLELLGPVILLIMWPIAKVRVVILVLLMLMHLGFSLTLDIGFFPYVNLAGLLLLFPAQFWDWIASKIVRPEHRELRIYYDAECGFCRKSCLILRSLFLWPGVSIMPATSDPAMQALLEKHYSWVIVGADGGATFHSSALSTLLRHSPLFLFRWMGRLIALSPIRWMGDHVYRIIGQNRGGLAAVTRIIFRERPIRTELPRMVQALIALLLSIAIYYNLVQLKGVRLPWPSALNEVVYSLRLAQRWNMFAPYPFASSGWLVEVGLTRDGRLINLQDGTPYDDTLQAHPADVPATFSSFRGLKYASMVFFEPKRAKLYPYYARTRCREWNEARMPGDPDVVTHVTITLMTEETGQDPAREIARPWSIVDYYACEGE